MALAQQVADIQSEFMQGQLSLELSKNQQSLLSHRSRQNILKEMSGSCGVPAGKSRGATRNQAAVNRIEQQASFSSLKRRNARQTQQNFYQKLSHLKDPKTTIVNKTFNEDGSAQYQLSATKAPPHPHMRSKLKTQGNGAARAKARDVY